MNPEAGDPEPSSGGGGGTGGGGGGSSLGSLLADYSANELRADEKWKGRTVSFTGTAGDIQRSAIGGITIQVGTGRAFEVPKVLCFVDDDQANAVKSISKGERINVQGTVDGLMIDVIVRHCVVGN